MKIFRSWWKRILRRSYKVVNSSKNIFASKKIILGAVLVLLLGCIPFSLFVVYGDYTSHKFVRSHHADKMSEKIHSTELSKGNKDEKVRNDPVSRDDHPLQVELAERRLELVKNTIDRAEKLGDITSAQADALSKKADELKEFKVSLEKMSRDQRHAAREEKLKELDSWLEENHINQNYLKRIL